MKNIVIGQSGGPTAVINSSLAGAMEYAFSREEIGTVYGMVNGIKGLLENNLLNLNEMFEGKDDLIERLRLSPAMFLGSCRYKLSENNFDDYEKIVEILNENNIGYFIYIGGNDSMDTVLKMSQYAEKNDIDIKFVGVPKTIDNDLVGIDHSPGFGSAAKFVSASVKDISYDTSIYAIKSVHIVEVMGRDAGWLAAASALARDEEMVAPHLIYMPEVAFSTDRFVTDVEEKLKKYNSVIVVVSEGIRDENGKYISAKSNKVDKFGHVMLCGTGEYLKGLVEENFGCKVRCLELGVLQRSAGHYASVTDDKFGHVMLCGTGEYLKGLVEENFGCKVRCLELGVLQRSAGHYASVTDIREAYNLGVYAVAATIKGESGKFSTLKRINSKPYIVEYGTENVSVVANQEKKVPRSWINKDGNDVTEEMLDYLRPLVKGSPQIPEKNGLPNYIQISHLDP